MKHEEAVALLNLGEASYFSFKMTEALSYYQKSLTLCKQIGDTSCITANYSNLGYTYIELSDYEKAQENFENALEFEKALQSDNGIAEALNNIGLTSDYLGKYKHALEYYLKALQLYEKINDKDGISTVSNNIGNVYQVWSNYEKALFYYLKSLAIEEELGTKSGIAVAFNNIGIIYHNWKNYDKALDYYKRGLKIEEELKNKSGIAESLNNIAIIYDETGKYKEAIELYERSLQIEEENDNKIGISVSLSNIGEFYEDRGDYDKALNYYNKSIVIDKEIENNIGIGQTYNQLGNLYTHLKQYNKAIDFYNLSNNIVEPLDIIETITENYKGLAEVYTKLKNYKKAIFFSNKYHSLKDSIFSETMLERQNNLQADFEIEKREKEIELLNTEKQVRAMEIKEKQFQLKQQKTLLFILFGGIASFIIFVLLLFRQIKNKNKAFKLLSLQNKEIEKNRLELINAKENAEESDRLKSSFLASVSHEIRTPINGILGVSEILKYDDLPKDQKNELLKLINFNGQQLVAILDDIIDISQIETGQLIIRIEDCNVDNILSELFHYYNEYKIIARKSNLEIKLNKPTNKTDLFIKTDSYCLKKILSNLIGNAIKFTQKGFVEFGYEKKTDGLQFFVKDTGIGIPAKNLKMIFERFRQVDETLTRQYGGTGLGLTISEQLVNLLDGNIRVESEEGKGSIFYFWIPISYNDVTNKETIITTTQKENYNWKGKQILIAEDVESNFKFMQTEILKTGASVLYARNGKEAIEIFKTQKNIDLILMDLQMPIIDGIEAAQEIKKLNKDVPIIALSSLAMKQQKEEILKLQFEEHISKPIKTEELFNKIRNYFSENKKSPPKAGLFRI